MRGALMWVNAACVSENAGQFIGSSKTGLDLISINQCNF
jgi:hypothetical protein